jgi:hypothetical protein
MSMDGSGKSELHFFAGDVQGARDGGEVLN